MSATVELNQEAEPSVLVEPKPLLSPPMSVEDPDIPIKEDDELLLETPPTPSPTATATTSATNGSSAPRRPPRKSTLTQQQKNQKRQRATQEQLNTLEVEFNKNPTPTAQVRERIAADINMTERSVQIWFQNRRAKIKNLAKKSIETGEDCDAIPESMRKYLAMQALESGKPFPSDIIGNDAWATYGGSLLMNTDSTASKVVITHFACQSLTIGTWRRVGQTALDLVVFYSPAKAMVTYYINADSSGFKIEYPFSYIKNISLDPGDTSSSAEGARQGTGGLVVELNRPPHFQMDPGSGGFYQCNDFTEGQQASQVLVHHLGGHPKVLSGQLAKLTTLDSFRNRHRPAEVNQIPASAPVSPVGPRPSSQPNHIFQPQMNLLPPEPHLTHFEMGPPAPRGHKRQRSRSVPIAMDFSQMRQSFTPFHNMPQQDFQPQIHTPIHTMQSQQPPLYAPVPQSANTLGPLGPTIRTDLASGYNFDFRAGPPSATTVNSTSEYDPSYFSAVIHPSDTFAGPHHQFTFSAPFLSPMPESSAMSNAAVSPYAALSPGEPFIANHSPPLNGFGRSASADVYSGVPKFDGDYAGDYDHVSPGWGEYDAFSKQSFPLPFRATGVDTPKDDYEFQDMVNFGDHVSLSPDHSGFSSNSQGSSGHINGTSAEQANGQTRAITVDFAQEA